jgi:hypothetical protein
MLLYVIFTIMLDDGPAMSIYQGNATNLKLHEMWVNWLELVRDGWLRANLYVYIIYIYVYIYIQCIYIYIMIILIISTNRLFGDYITRN